MSLSVCVSVCFSSSRTSSSSPFLVCCSVCLSLSLCCVCVCYCVLWLMSFYYSAIKLTSLRASLNAEVGQFVQMKFNSFMSVSPKTHRGGCSLSVCLSSSSALLFLCLFMWVSLFPLSVCLCRQITYFYTVSIMTHCEKIIHIQYLSCISVKNIK